MGTATRLETSIHYSLMPTLIGLSKSPDPILNAYGGTSDSPVIATGPIFLQGGLYHFIVRIATVDFDRTMILDNKQPIFDGYLSVGNIENFRAIVGGNEIPVKILS